MRLGDPFAATALNRVNLLLWGRLALCGLLRWDGSWDRDGHSAGRGWYSLLLPLSIELFQEAKLFDHGHQGIHIIRRPDRQLQEEGRAGLQAVLEHICRPIGIHPRDLIKQLPISIRVLTECFRRILLHLLEGLGLLDLLIACHEPCHELSLELLKVCNRAGLETVKPNETEVPEAGGECFAHQGVTGCIDTNYISEVHQMGVSLGYSRVKLCEFG